MEKTVHIKGVIGEDVTLLNVIEQTSDPQPQRYIVEIDSPGGFVTEGFQIYDYLKGLEVPITTRGLKEVSSIATVIFMAGDVREVQANTKFLIHKVAVTMPEGVTMHDTDLIAMAKKMQEDEKSLLKFYRENSTIPEHGIEKLINQETTLTPENLKQFGIIHNVIPTAQSMKTVKLIRNSTVNALLKMGVVKVVNMNVETANGEALYIYSEDGELPGKQAVLADGEGNPTETPAPDGEHTLTDGRVLTIENGIVTAVSEASSENKEGEKKDEQYDEKAVTALVNKRVEVLEKALNAKFEALISAIASNYNTKPNGNGETKTQKQNSSHAEFMKSRLNARTHKL